MLAEIRSTLKSVKNQQFKPAFDYFILVVDKPNTQICLLCLIQIVNCEDKLGYHTIILDIILVIIGYHILECSYTYMKLDHRKKIQ